MAERRMFAKTIIDSDAFLDMPLSTQTLYFHLSMRADDDGFINNPKKIQRMIGASDDDLKLLIAKSFIIPFESGIVVIKHWKIHNYIQSDRYKPTVYQEEKTYLETKKNRAYTLLAPEENQSDTECIHDVYSMETQVSLDKTRLEEIRGESYSSAHECANELPPPSKPVKQVKHKYGEYANVLLSDAEINKLQAEIPNYETYIERLSNYIASKGVKYKSHYATIRNWYRKDNEKNPNAKPIYTKPTAADQLNDAYNMMAAWSEGDTP